MGPFLERRAGALDENWWSGDACKEGWYTSVYPWTWEQNGVTLDQEMSKFDSVQRMLDRCSAAWSVAEDGRDIRRFLVKATIAPVMFLGKQIMDITVEVDYLNSEPA